MFEGRLQSLLEEPKIVYVTTVQPDGYPHTVPIWFKLDAGDIVMFTARSSRKTRNVLENAKGCLAIGGDPLGSPAYLIDGDITVEEDPDKTTTALVTNHYEPPERAAEWLADWADEDFVILRLTPRRVTTVG